MNEAEATHVSVDGGTVTAPAIGETVHYVSYGTPGGEYQSECRAAMVTAIDSLGGTDGITPMRASLAVLNPTGLFFNTNLAHDEDQAPGTWHWPCGGRT